MGLIRASDWKEEPHEWLIPGILGSAITLISGEPKTGKTLLAGYLVDALISQKPILGRTPKPGKFSAAWIGYDSLWASELQNRFPEIQKSLYFSETPLRFNDLHGWQNLENDLYVRDIKLLVIDNLYGYAGELDLDEAHFMEQALRPLVKIHNDCKIPVLLLHHANKMGGGRAAHSILLEAKVRHFVRITGNIKSFNRELMLAGNYDAGSSVKIHLSPQECRLRDEAGDSIKEKRVRNRNGEMSDKARAFHYFAPPVAKQSALQAGYWMASQGYSTTNAGGRTLINKMLSGGLLIRPGGNKSPITVGPNLVL
jgi:hypothetical protein